MTSNAFVFAACKREGAIGPVVNLGGSIGRLLGPAAASPLTMSVSEWRIDAAVAWRF